MAYRSLLEDDIQAEPSKNPKKQTGYVSLLDDSPEEQVIESPVVNPVQSVQPQLNPLEQLAVATAENPITNAIANTAKDITMSALRTSGAMLQGTSAFTRGPNEENYKNEWLSNFLENSGNYLTDLSKNQYLKTPETKITGPLNTGDIGGAFQAFKENPMELLPTVAKYSFQNVVPGVAAVATGGQSLFPEMTGYAYDRLVREKGVKPKDAAWLAIGEGVVNAGLENVMGVVPVLKQLAGGEVSRKLAEKEIKNIIEKGLSIVGGTVKTSLEESFEEAAQQITSNFVDKSAGIDTDLFSGVPQSAVGGFLGGLGLGVAGHAGIQVQKDLQPQELERLPRAKYTPPVTKEQIETMVGRQTINPSVDRLLQGSVFENYVTPTEQRLNKQEDLENVFNQPEPVYADEYGNSIQEQEYAGLEESEKIKQRLQQEQDEISFYQEERINISNTINENYGGVDSLRQMIANGEMGQEGQQLLNDLVEAESTLFSQGLLNPEEFVATKLPEPTPMPSFSITPSFQDISVQDNSIIESFPNEGVEYYSPSPQQRQNIPDDFRLYAENAKQFENYASWLGSLKNELSPEEFNEFSKEISERGFSGLREFFRKKQNLKPLEYDFARAQISSIFDNAKTSRQKIRMLNEFVENNDIDSIPDENFAEIINEVKENYGNQQTQGARELTEVPNGSIISSQGRESNISIDGKESSINSPDGADGSIEPVVKQTTKYKTIEEANQRLNELEQQMEDDTLGFNEKAKILSQMPYVEKDIRELQEQQNANKPELPATTSENPTVAKNTDVDETDFVNTEKADQPTGRESLKEKTINRLTKELESEEKAEELYNNFIKNRHDKWWETLLKNRNVKNNIIMPGIYHLELSGSDYDIKENKIHSILRAHDDIAENNAIEKEESLYDSKLLSNPEYKKLFDEYNEILDNKKNIRGVINQRIYGEKVLSPKRDELEKIAKVLSAKGESITEKPVGEIIIGTIPPSKKQALESLEKIVNNKEKPTGEKDGNNQRERENTPDESTEGELPVYNGEVRDVSREADRQTDEAGGETEGNDNQRYNENVDDRGIRDSDNSLINATYKNQVALNKAIKEFIDTEQYSYYGDNLPQPIKSWISKYDGFGGIHDTEGAGSLTEYYTDERIIKKMWDIAGQYVNAKDVFEPSVGVGRFFKFAPDGTNLSGIEMDKTSSTIAQLVYPEARIKTGKFQDLFLNKIEREAGFVDEKIPDNQNPNIGKYDLVIGNPPYGDYKSTDGEMYVKENPYKAGRIEDYFIARGLDLVKENGVVAYLVQDSFLKSGNGKIKEIIAGKSDLVAAYKLPQGVFDRTKNLITDIIVLRKTSSPSGNTDILSNSEYFKQNPDSILGEYSERKGRFGNTEQVVKGDLDSGLESIKTAKKDVKETSSVKKETPGPEKTKFRSEAKKKEQAQPIEKASVNYETYRPDNSNYTNGEMKVWAATRVDGTTDFLAVGIGDKEVLEYLNYEDGNYYNNFNYFQGNIYNKLDQLEKDKKKISSEQYEKQKKGLEAVLPQKLEIENIDLTPTGSFISDYKNGDKSILQSAVYDFLYSRDINADDLGEMSKDEIASYILGKNVKKYPVRAPDKDDSPAMKKKLNAERDAYVNKRQIVGDSVFNRFLRTKIPIELQNKIVSDYNRSFNAEALPDYNKVPLFVKNISKYFKNKEFALYDVQKEGAGFFTIKGTGLIGFEVGVGKTITGSVAMMQALELRRAKRPLVIVPKSTYNNWIEEMTQLMPNIKIHKLKGLGKDSEINVKDLRDGDVMLATYEALNHLWYSESAANALKNELSKVARDDKTERNERESKKYNEELSALYTEAEQGNSKKYDLVKLGVDYVMFDEAHKGKNLFSSIRLDKDAEGGGKQSNKYSKINLSKQDSTVAKRMFLLSQHVLMNNGDRNVAMLTATPFNNHPVEIFNMLSYVARNDLNSMGLNNVYDFMEMFADMSYDWVITSSGTIDYRPIFKGFKNLKILRQIINKHILFRTADDAGINRPDKTQVKAVLSPTSEQEFIFKEIREKLTSGATKQEELLAMLAKARKATISDLFADNIKHDNFDYSDSFMKKMYDIPENPTEQEKVRIFSEIFIDSSPKLKYILECVASSIKDDSKTSQIIYSPYAKDYFKYIKNYLVNNYDFISEENIATSEEETAKNNIQDMADALNDRNNPLKIIIGTKKIREGLNLNKNSSSLYVLATDWNPTDQIQIEGRIHRQGNRYDDIRVVYPLLRGSSDSFMFQKLSEKIARFNNIWESADDYFSMEGINADDEKFALITDPEVKADFSIKKDEMEKSQEIKFLENKAKEIPGYISQYEKINRSIVNAGRNVEQLEKKLSTSKQEYDVVKKEYDEAKKLFEVGKKKHKNEPEIVSQLELKFKRIESRFEVEKKYIKDINKEIKEQALSEQNAISYKKSFLQKMSDNEIDINNTEVAESRFKAKIDKLKEEAKQLKEKRDSLVSKFKEEQKELNANVKSTDELIEEFSKKNKDFLHMGSPQENKNSEAKPKRTSRRGSMYIGDADFDSIRENIVKMFNTVKEALAEFIKFSYNPVKYFIAKAKGKAYIVKGQPNPSRKTGNDIYSQNINIQLDLSEKNSFSSSIKNSMTEFGNNFSLIYDKWFLPIDTRLFKISPRLQNMVRRFTFDFLQVSKKDGETIMPFLEKSKEMDTDDFLTLDLALKNGDIEKTKEIVKKYNMEKEYNDVRNLLENLHDQAIDSGIDVGFVENYYPRMIKNNKLDAYLEYFEKLAKNEEVEISKQALNPSEAKYSIIKKELRENDKYKNWNTEEKAKFINSKIRGFGQNNILLGRPGQLRASRKIETLTPEMNLFYKPFTEALAYYIPSTRKSIEDRKFFGGENEAVSKLRLSLKQKRNLLVEVKDRSPMEAKGKELTRLNYELFGNKAKLESNKNNPDEEFVKSIKDKVDFLEKQVEFIKKIKPESAKKIVINRILKDIKKIEEKISEELLNNEFDVEKSIGAMVNDLVDSGTIYAKDERIVRELLLAKFNFGKVVEVTAALRDLSYIGTLNDFGNAIVQFGDLGLALYKNGMFDSAKGLIRPEITRQDLGLETMAEEFRTKTVLSETVNKLFKIIGFDAVDSLGKNTLMNGYINKARNQAKDNNKSLDDKLEFLFEEKSTQVKKDLIENKITDDVLYLAFNSLADVQPITMDQMTEVYSKGGVYRLFYMLKTYSLKIIDVMRNDIGMKISQGVKTKDKKLIIEGLKNLVLLQFFMALFGIPKDLLLDWLLGRDIDIPETAMDNILIFLVINRFMIKKSQREGIAGTVLDYIAPPVVGMADTLQGDVKKIASGKKDAEDVYFWNHIPVIGRPWYWHFGGGSDSKNKAQNSKKMHKAIEAYSNKQMNKFVSLSVEMIKSGYYKDYESFEKGFKSTKASMINKDFEKAVNAFQSGNNKVMKSEIIRISNKWYGGNVNETVDVLTKKISKELEKKIENN